MAYVLGVDGGGTKSKSLLIDENRNVLGRAKGLAANIRSEGVERVCDNLSSLIEDNCQEAGVEPTSLSTICLGLAGASTSEGKKAVLEGMTKLGYNEDIILIESDAAVALAGAHNGSDGIIAISGTGMAVFGQKQGQSVSSGAWGHILGDEGSAYWVGIEGMKAVLAADDMRIPPTSLTKLFLDALNIKKANQLVDFVHGINSKSEIAALARLVLDESANDEQARKIIQLAALHLYEHIAVVFRRLSGNLPVCLIGGLIENETSVRIELIKKLEMGNIPFIDEPLHVPEYGAAMIGLDWHI
jgi:N-acetylglucosamine kinase-like BadF-type ATPase